MTALIRHRPIYSYGVDLQFAGTSFWTGKSHSPFVHQKIFHLVTRAVWKRTLSLKTAHVRLID